MAEFGASRLAAAIVEWRASEGQLQTTLPRPVPIIQYNESRLRDAVLCRDQGAVDELLRVAEGHGPIELVLSQRWIKSTQQADPADVKRMEEIATELIRKLINRFKKYKKAVCEGGGPIPDIGARSGYVPLGVLADFRIFWMFLNLPETTIWVLRKVSRLAKSTPKYMRDGQKRDLFWPY